MQWLCARQAIFRALYVELAPEAAPRIEERGVDGVELREGAFGLFLAPAMADDEGARFAFAVQAPSKFTDTIIMSFGPAWASPEL